MAPVNGSQSFSLVNASELKFLHELSIRPDASATRVRVFIMIISGPSSSQ